MNRSFSAVVALLAAVLSPTLAHPQGFGTISKKKVSLHRKLPASAHLPGNAVQIKVTARDTKNNDIAVHVADLMETELLKYDKNLRVDQTKPDSVISCIVTNYSLPPAESITKNVMVTKKIGKDLRTIEEPKRYYVIKGSLDMTYQVKDTQSGKMVDSDTINAKYSGEFEADSGTTSSDSSTLAKGFGALKSPWKKVSGNKSASDQQSAPTPSELQQLLAKEAASQVATRLVNTDETIEVLLARGRLDEGDKMAEAGLWDRYLESMEQMPPLPDKADDAYRLYNIGVAYEALGYKAEDSKAAKKFFDEAAINYGKAIDARPSEKYFLEPQTRIETALAHYRKIEQQPTVNAERKVESKDKDKDEAVDQDTNTTAKATDKPKARTVAHSTKPPVSNAALKEKASPADVKPQASGPPLTNDQVIKLFKAGMDEENLVAMINEAGTTQFDMSVDGQLQLVNAGVKGKVLAAMRHRTGAQSHKAKLSQ